MLDVINSVLYETASRQRLKATAAAYFKPQAVSVSPLRLLVGALFEPDICLADHLDQPVRTATYGALVRYLNEYGLRQEEMVLVPEKRPESKSKSKPKPKSKQRIQRAE